MIDVRKHTMKCHPLASDHSRATGLGVRKRDAIVAEESAGPAMPNILALRDEYAKPSPSFRCQRQDLLDRIMQLEADVERLERIIARLDAAPVEMRRASA